MAIGDRRDAIGKMGQVTIFIIVAMILVVGIVSYFLFFYNGIGSQSISADTTKYIKSCVEKSAKPIIENLEGHGGVYYNELSDWEFISFDGIKVPLVCYTNTTKEICVNRHPLLQYSDEKKIESLIRPVLTKCFSEVKPNIVKEGVLNFSVQIIKDEILLNIRKSLQVSSEDGDASVSFNNFDVRVNSDLYNFIEMQNAIVNMEVSCDCSQSNCNADLRTMNIEYPYLITTRFMTENHEKIYTISSNLNKNKFVFGVKNCING
jgi:hypothetical protein